MSVHGDCLNFWKSLFEHVCVFLLCPPVLDSFCLLSRWKFSSRGMDNFFLLPLFNLPLCLGAAVQIEHESGANKVQDF